MPIKNKIGPSLANILNRKIGSRKDLLNYFIRNKLKSLMENIGDF